VVRDRLRDSDTITAQQRRRPFERGERSIRSYEPNPRYAPVDGSVVAGWAAAVADLPPSAVTLALDGPAILPWATAVDGLATALEATGRRVTRTDVRDALLPWARIVELTASPELPDDADFATLAAGTLADLFADVPAGRKPGDDVHIVFGPGAALVEHDVLWYADLPKRHAEAGVAAGTERNLGQRPEDGSGTTRRLFYVDWPLLDRHRDSILERIDRWVDVQDATLPASVDGPTLRRTGAALSARPFRTRPTFNTVSWGGHWGQRVLGMNREARNTGLGYELIAPESGVLVGSGAEAQVEIPLQLLVTQCPGELLGPEVHAVFGTSFPIRFDYLDTVDGGSLSVHCHPQLDYMRRVFGWPYTQHETYYVMVGGARSRVYLGLRGDVDVAAFERSAHAASHDGRPFDIERYVQTFPATPHQLFTIPAGTPHGSGEGNVVLEVSATPYLYSLRFYDWLRRDREGRQRPVHVEHAFANLDTARTGDAVERDLVQQPRTVRDGAGWREELLGSLPEMFYEVRRLVLDDERPVPDDTAGRFHVLNVVDGDGVRVETASGFTHDVAYAETIVVPAAVGSYAVSRVGDEPVRVVKAFVR
jgi:hypothetical protein